MKLTLLALSLLVLGGPVPAPSDPSTGVGVVQVAFTAPLYFYGDPPGHPSLATPLDSLTFRSGPHHVEVAYAPPWFAPDDFKLDYDLLYLRAVSLRRDWIEVVVHTTDVRWPPQTRWIAREAVTFRSWPEFLLEVFSVESLAPTNHPLRIAPQDEADPVVSDQDDYRVLGVEGEWLLVEGADAREVGTPRGWLRWRADDRLLIRYNLLS